MPEISHAPAAKRQYTKPQEESSARAQAKPDVSAARETQRQETRAPDSAVPSLFSPFSWFPFSRALQGDVGLAFALPQTMFRLNEQIFNQFQQWQSAAQNAFFNGIPGLGGRASMDAREREYVFTVEMQAFSPKDIHVDVSRQSLHIVAETHAQERHARIERMFALAQDSDAKAARARFSQGVLTVTVPRAEPTSRQSWRLDVQNA